MDELIFIGQTGFFKKYRARRQKRRKKKMLKKAERTRTFYAKSGNLIATIGHALQAFARAGLKTFRQIQRNSATYLAFSTRAFKAQFQKLFTARTFPAKLAQTALVLLASSAVFASGLLLGFATFMTGEKNV